MTLVLALHGRENLWVLADRRLSYGAQRLPVDNAMKMVTLETSDGIGVLAYAGLGATSRNTQPSEWMNAVLRGRGGLTFEHALSHLVDAAAKELPRQLVRLPGGGGTHQIVIAAYLYGLGPRLYTIDHHVDPSTRRHSYGYADHRLIVDPDERPQAPRYAGHRPGSDPWLPAARIAATGTGGQFLEKHWLEDRRELFNLVKANDKGKVSELVVADYLASLNWRAHLGVRDGTVGPRCIVVWRRRPKSRVAGSSAHQTYDGLAREADTGVVPSIVNGLDINALIALTMPNWLERLSDPDLGLELDAETINRRLRDLPTEPDDKLR